MTSTASGESDVLELPEGTLAIRSDAPAALEEIRRRQPSSVRIRGWNSPSLKPLVEAATGLTRLAIECPVEDVSAISDLATLERLSLREGLGRIDFSRLPRLRQLSIWSPREDYRTLADARQLKVLWITNGGLRDLTPLQVIPQLEELQVSEAPLKSLEGLRALTELRHLVLSQLPLATLDLLAEAKSLSHLRLSFLPGVRTVQPLQALLRLKALAIDSLKKAQDLEVIGALQNLESLSLDGVQITDASFLDRLGRLEMLHLGNIGPLESIGFVGGMHRLREFRILSNIKIADEDTAILAKLPALREVSFFDRKAYTMSLAEVRAAIAARAQ